MIAAAKTNNGNGLLNKGCENQAYIRNRLRKYP